jgi:hypothetical protein
MRGIALACLLLVACGSDDGSRPDAGPGDIALACESGGTTFPPLDKTCGVPSDCFVAVHTMNCCGTQVAIGLNVSAEPSFASAEAVCDAAYPACGCAQFPTTAEDGRSEELGPLQVDCRAGRCFTYVP